MHRIASELNPSDQSTKLARFNIPVLKELIINKDKYEIINLVHWR